MTSTEPGRRMGSVLMIVHAYYDEDPRVRREAESLVASGRSVTVIGLRRPGDAPTGHLDGVEVVRLDVQRHQGASLITYLREYLSFGTRAAWRSIRLHRGRRFGLVEVHSLPDFLVFAGLPLRIVGVPVVLNLHEAMPEFFQSRFARATNPVFDRLLHWQERLAIAFSSATLSVNDAMRDRLVRLGIRPEKVTVVANAPSLARFDIAVARQRAFREDGSLRLVYAGALTPTYEVEVGLLAVARLVRSRPDLELRFDVYGRGDSEPMLRAMAEDLGIAERVVFHGRIAIEAMPAAIAAADIGLAPTRRNDFTVLTMSTKIHEYAAMGKPVVATRLPMVERTFPEGSLMLYESGDVDAMVEAIRALADDPAQRAAAIERAAAIVRASSWEVESRRYLAIVDRLTRDRLEPLPQATPSR